MTEPPAGICTPSSDAGVDDPEKPPPFSEHVHPGSVLMVVTSGVVLLKAKPRVEEPAISGHVVGVAAEAWRAGAVVAAPAGEASPEVVESPQPATATPAAARAQIAVRGRRVIVG